MRFGITIEVSRVRRVRPLMTLGTGRSEARSAGSRSTWRGRGGTRWTRKGGKRVSEYSPESLSSGPSAATDPTLVSGQDPMSLFGMDARPWYSTGAAGTPGVRPPTGGTQVDYTMPTGDPHFRPTTAANLSGPGDSTTVVSQGYEGISGLGPDDISNTGAGHGSVSTPRHPGAGS